MDKVLYIGHLLEGFSGWSRASYEYIRALSTQFDVVARPVRLNRDIRPPDDIVDCINKPISGSKYCVQHVLPHFLEFSSQFEKNVGIAILESNNLLENDWIRRINLMDEVWVPYDYKENSITKQIRKVPHAANLANYEVSQEVELPPGYNFYTICDFTRRKNLNAIIRAFHTEFSVNEPVNLILKLSKFNTSPSDCAKLADEMSHTIKNALKLYSRGAYKNDYLITHDLNEFEINGLHKGCDCYVSSAYGEAFGWPIFDSMAHGNTVIALDQGGPIEYLQYYDNKHLVESHKEPCFAALDTFDQLYSSFETWDVVSILGLQRAMRKAYEEKKKTEAEGKLVVGKFSYTAVGNIAKEVLEI